jgi:hypothetical protein
LGRAAGALAIGAALFACSKSTPPPPPADTDGPATRDRARLEAIVTADATFDRAMKTADDAERAGDDARAAAILTGDAAKAADDAITAAGREPLETPWAAARRDSLVAVLKARKDTLPKYAAALKGDDLAAKLTAVQTQLELQKWAMDAAQAALAPAPAGAPDAGER